MTPTHPSDVRLELLAQVRQAVRRSGQTVTAIAEAVGMERTHLQNFLAGDRGLSDKKLAQLLDISGFEIKAKICLKKAKRG